MNDSRTIVIVDDDTDSRKIYTTMLQHLGYDTVTASDGEEALGVIRRIIPDAVVTDFRIPHLDGCELVKALSRDVATAHIPAILVTADARPETRELAERAGCADFLLKPSDPAQIAAAIQRLIGPAQPLEQTG